MVRRGVRIDEVGLTAKRHDDRLARRDAARMPPALFDRNMRPAVVADAHLVGVLLAGQRRGRQAGADLDALDGIDRHHRGGEVRHRACRRSARPSRPARPRPRPRSPRRPTTRPCGCRRDSRPSASASRRPGEKKGCRSTSSQSQRGAVDLRCRRSGPARRGSSRRARLARDGAGRDAHGGLARRGAAAAAIVANAVFRLVGEVGVAGPELVLDVASSPCARWSTLWIRSEIGVPVVTWRPLRRPRRRPRGSRPRRARGAGW